MDTVKIKSDNPAHPKGYYIQFSDRVKPGDVIYTGEKEQPKAEPPEPKKKRGKK
jgi:hypothetical protein